MMATGRTLINGEGVKQGSGSEVLQIAQELYENAPLGARPAKSSHLGGGSESETSATAFLLRQ